MKWVLARLKEKSTWKGLVWLLTACGVAVNTEQTDAIITAGLAIAGAIDVMTVDK